LNLFVEIILLKFAYIISAHTPAYAHGFRMSYTRTYRGLALGCLAILPVDIRWGSLGQFLLFVVVYFARLFL